MPGKGGTETAIVSIDAQQAGEGIVRLVFFLNRNPDDGWKRTFENSSISYASPGAAAALQHLVRPKLTRAEIHWTVPSAQVDTAKDAVRQRVDIANAQPR